MADIENEKEAKFFRLSVLGILASRQDVESEYKHKLDFNQTIEEFFIQQEGIGKTQFDDWKEKHQQEIERIRNSANSDRIKGFGGRKEYLNWYLEHPKQCCYCGIEESKLKLYFNEDNLQYIDARQRGKFLEIERIETAPKEKNLYNPSNCTLVCYVCNNAKSDFISAQNFMPIAKGIHGFWSKLGIEVNFPINSSIWGK